MEKQQVMIDADVHQATMIYLSTRPYREVAGLMQGLDAGKPVAADSVAQPSALAPLGEGFQRVKQPEALIDPREKVSDSDAAQG